MPEPGTPADSGADIFTHIAKTRGPLPAGDYAAEFLVAFPFETPKTKGATAHLKITESEWRGRQIELRFVQDGPPSLDWLIVRDADALLAWRQAVGAEGRPAADFDSVLKQIWKASRGKRVLIKLRVAPRAGSTVGEMFLAGARIDDRYDF